MNKGTESNAPLFITGVYRSGTTLITQILNLSHEINLTYDTLQYLRFYFDQYNSPKDEYNEIVNKARSRLSQRFSIELNKEKVIKKLQQYDVITHGKIYDEIMKTAFGEEGEVRWGEKSVLEWSSIPTFFEMFPKGKAIHVLRDPRDVLASYRENTIEEEARYLDAIFACLHSMDWAKSHKKQLSEDRYYILRHEDLVTAPRKTVVNICQFLGIEFEQRMLDSRKFSDRKGESDWTANTAFGDVKQEDGITDQTVNRWKEYLSEFEIVFAESIIRHLLTFFDYESSEKVIGEEELGKLWKKIENTPLIQERLQHWWATGKGVESYPSDPTQPENWGNK